MAKNMMKQNTNGAMKATTIRGEKHVHVDTPAKPKVSAVSDDKALNASYREDTLGRSKHHDNREVMVMVTTSFRIMASQ